MTKWWTQSLAMLAMLVLAVVVVPRLAAADDEKKPDAAPGSAQSSSELFKKLDKNGDGLVTRDEVPEEQQRMFNRLLRGDKNEDGKLSTEEFAAGLQEAPRRPADGDSPQNPRGERPQGAEAEAFFKQMDKNGDGKVTLEEVPEERREGFKRMLERVDADGDKAASLEEFKKGFGGPGPARPGQPGNPEGVFKAIDKNGDGKITADEVPDDRRERFTENLAKFDVDGDKALNLDEFRKAFPLLAGGEQPRQPGAPGGPPMPGGGEALLRAIDTDGDGKLSESEIGQATSALKRLDKNGDGSITRDELMASMPQRRPDGAPPGQTPEGMVAYMLRERDTNKDGKISKDEAGDRMRENFQNIDSNGDGFLDEVELKQMVARFRPGAGQQPPGEKRRPDGEKPKEKE